MIPSTSEIWPAQKHSRKSGQTRLATDKKSAEVTAFCAEAETTTSKAPRTTILAAERTGRIARVIELDPLYVDVAVRRWEQTTGIPARHADSQMCFEELAAKRGLASSAVSAPARSAPSRSARR